MRRFVVLPGDGYLDALEPVALPAFATTAHRARRLSATVLAKDHSGIFVQDVVSMPHAVRKDPNIFA